MMSHPLKDINASIRNADIDRLSRYNNTLNCFDNDPWERLPKYSYNTDKNASTMAENANIGAPSDRHQSNTTGPTLVDQYNDMCICIKSANKLIPGAIKLTPAPVQTNLPHPLSAILMKFSTCGPLLMAYLPLAATSRTAEWLVEIYSSLVESNFGNFSFFDGADLDIFSPKIYNPKYESKELAENIARAIEKYLSYSTEDENDSYRVLPKQDVKRIIEKYPDAFSLKCCDHPLFDVNELLTKIEIQQFAVLKPSKLYESFLADSKAFKTLFSENLFNEGFVLTVLLVNEHVQREYINLYGPRFLQEAQYAELSLYDRWKRFFIQLQTHSIDEAAWMKDELEPSSYLLATFRLLISDGHTKKLLEQLQRHKTPKLLKAIFKIIYGSSRPLYPPIISLDDLRTRVDYESSSVASFEYFAASNNDNHLLTAPSDILNEIFKHCIENDWLHTTIVCPRVCKRFHQFTTVTNISNLQRIISYSEDAAKRLINDTNRYTVDSEKFLLGYPWNVSNRNDIFSLYVQAVTQSQKAWTLDDLLEEYVQECPEIRNLSMCKENVYGRWNTLTSTILGRHRFTDANQYLQFAKRAIIVSIFPIQYHLNEHLDNQDAARCLEDLLADVEIAKNLRFDSSSMAHILSSLTFANQKELMDKMINCNPNSCSRLGLYYHLFAETHFQADKRHKEALELVSISLNGNPESDLNPSNETIAKILVLNVKYFKTSLEDEAVKFLVKEISDGRLKLSAEPSLLNKWIMNYYCKNRRSEEEFRHFLSAANLNASGITEMYNAMRDHAFLHGDE